MIWGVYPIADERLWPSSAVSERGRGGGVRVDGVHLEGSPERNLAWSAAFTPLQRPQAHRPGVSPNATRMFKRSEGRAPGEPVRCTRVDVDGKLSLAKIPRRWCSRLRKSQETDTTMCRKRHKWVWLGVLLAALAMGLSGCVEPQGYSDWRWKQLNPAARPLPGDPDYY